MSSLLIKASRVTFTIPSPDGERDYPVSIYSASLARWSRAYFGNVNESRRHLLVFIAEKAKYSLWTLMNYDEMTLLALASNAGLAIYDMLEFLATETDDVVNSVIESTMENNGEGATFKVTPQLCTCDECEGRI